MQRISLDVQPGLNIDDTSFTVGTTGWVQTDKIRFHRGRPQIIGGWEAVSPESFDGVCRGLREWRDNALIPNIAVGTHTNLFVYQSGDKFDITPVDFVPGNIDGIGGSGYGTGTYSTGLYSRPSDADFVALTWSFANFGETLLANPRNQTVWQWSNDVSEMAVSLGRTEAGSDDLTSYANQTAFDAVWTRGTGWTFDAANDQADCDGTQVSDSDLTRDFTGLTVNKWYRVEITYSNRTAGTISAIGGSIPIVGEAQNDANGTIVAVFLAASTTETVGARADEDFIGSVDGVTLYELNAPDQITCISVPSQRRHLVAYGCNEEATDEFNARAVRWSAFAAESADSLRNWTSLPDNNAGEFVLEGSGRIVTAKEGPYGTFIWTTSELWFQEFVGAPGQTYRFTRIGTECGCIGANAAIVYEGYAYWVSPDVSWWRAAPGQAPQKIITPLQEDVEGVLSFVQQDKIYAASIGEYGEVVWFYPDSRDGNENSRYVLVNVRDNTWATGQLPRTAFIDAGSQPSPLATSYDAEADTGQLFYHERGTTANGGPIEWSMKTGDFYLSDASEVIQLKGIWPDVEDQQGLAQLTIGVKRFPQGDEREEGPFNMQPDQDRVHFLTSGRILNMTFSGNSAPARFRLGRINLEFNKRGNR